MPDSGFRSVAPRRRRWLLFVPFVLVVVLAAVWTVVWFYAARRAEADLATWQQRERQAGRTQTCASQSIGGYPFLLEVRCGGAGLELQGTPTLQFKLPLAVAAVQVYDPKLLIGEFTGPLEVSEAKREAAAVINWTLGQASVRGLPSGVERASLVLVGPTVRAPSLVGNDPVLSARRMELHARPAPGSGTDSPAVEAALRLEVAVVGIEKILKMLDIDRMMTEGQVGARFNALDRLIPGLGGMARQSAAPSLIAALGERTELEGKPAVAFPIRFDDGTVFLGPFRVGAV